MTEHANASDLVKRLRQQSWCGPLHIEAADEIERLRALLLSCRKAMEHSNQSQSEGIRTDWSCMIGEINSALEQRVQEDGK